MEREALIGIIKDNRWLDEITVRFTLINQDEETTECYANGWLSEDCKPGQCMKIYGERDSGSGLFRVRAMAINPPVQFHLRLWQYYQNATKKRFSC